MQAPPPPSTASPVALQHNVAVRVGAASWASWGPAWGLSSLNGGGRGLRAQDGRCRAPGRAAPSRPHTLPTAEQLGGYL